MGAPSELRRRMFTVDEYYRIAETGIFAEDGRIDLVEGELIEMPPIGPDHAHVHALLDRSFQKQLDDSIVVYTQCSFALPPRSSLLPDLLLCPDSVLGARRPLGAGDALLVVEVADTALRYDRRTKLGIYARQGIPEYWTVDVGRQRVLVHREPEAGGYRVTQVAGKAGRVSSQRLPNVGIDVSKIFPESPSE